MSQAPGSHAARGIVSFLANVGLIGLSTYSTNILTLLVIAAVNLFTEAWRARFR